MACSTRSGYTDETIEEILGPGGASTPVLIIAAHMDDEAIGIGALLKHLKNVSVLHITDGAARNMRAARARGFSTRQGYSLARRAETAEALSLMPSAPMDLETLDVPDLDAAFNLSALALAVKEHIIKTAPGVVITQPYEGGHPDHDSAAFAVSSARQLLLKEGKSAPAVLESASYHAEGPRMATTAFLPKGPEALRVELGDGERLFKEEMFRCYRTQKGALRNFPIGVEMLRRAPDYDFFRPPHEGRLFYQRFDWGLPGLRWCSLAARAARELGVGEGRVERDYSAVLNPRAIYRYMRYLRTKTAFL